MNEIGAKSIVLAEYLGYKYIPSNDLQGFSKAGWYISRDFDSPFMESHYKKSSDYYIGRNIYDLGFYNSYDRLFEVVRKLEKEDLKDYFYTWEESDEGIKYNFTDISVERLDGKWTVDINLKLDPPITFFKEGDTDLQQLFYSLFAAVEYINEIKNENL